MSPDLDVVATFLLRLRSSWVLTAIVPDGKTTTKPYDNTESACTFVTAHNSDKNMYYSVNEVKPGANLNKKLSKSDIAQVVFLHADLDPREDETPEAAKTRYLGRIAAFKYKPTFIIDSGNGIQVLWRITAVGPERFAQAEAINKWITLELGSKSGTQNIDRILRLPGTINWPNAVKLRAGRVPVMSACLAYNELVAYDIDDFELPMETAAAASAEPVFENDVLWWTIKTGGNYQDVGKRSEGVWWCINEMFRRGYCMERIRGTMLNKGNLITRHIFDQGNPAGYADAQIAKANRELAFVLDERTRRPMNVQYNLRIALMKLGVSVRYNEFNDRMLVEGLDGFGPELSDDAVLHIRMTCQHVYKFYPGKDMTFEVLMEMTRLNRFHPVRDYFAGLKWDGVERIDKWLSVYAGAEETDYTRAVGALMLIATVRRIKQPGCKFDEVLVLESPIQGTDKSSALSILAVRPEWFTDDVKLDLDSKQVIEKIRGCMIIELGELSGMKRAEVEHIKAFASRTRDRARMSYDRLTTDVPRQQTFWGTTNDSQYLKDTSGNRRFWPVRVKVFDLVGLKRDRDQLWAEAVVREASGGSIRLDQSLWAEAAQEQAKREVSDPYEDAIEYHLGHFNNIKITANDLRNLLDARAGSFTQDQNQRMGKAAIKQGFKRQNTAGTINAGGKWISGWVKGDGPWRLVLMSYDPDTRQPSPFLTSDDEAAPGANGNGKTHMP